MAAAAAPVLDERAIRKIMSVPIVKVETPKE